MKRMISCIVVSLCAMVVAGQSQNVKPRSVKPKAEICVVEREAAYSWLTKHAADSIVQRIQLRAVRHTDEWVLFCDADDRGFVLVAKQAYWPYAGQPILAFSTEYTYALDHPTMAILQYYTTRLQILGALGLTPEREHNKGMYVAPLLGHTAWGQTAPYNNA